MAYIGNKVNGGLADGNAVVSGTLDVSNNVTLSADVTIGDDLVLTDDLFFGTDATVINFGADNDVTLTHVHDTGILLNSSKQLQFGDSGTYIHQSADGVLDLVSDTEIEINATTIDINGAVDISNGLDVGTITTSTLATLRLKTAGSNNAVALNIEENSGNEGWGLGVNADGDLKFYNSGTGTSTGNSAVTFSDDNKVGIGASSPSDDLHIASSVATIRLEDNDIANGEAYSKIFTHSHGGIELSADPDNNRSTTDIRFTIDGTERGRIGASETVFNEDSLDQDFRVEGNGDTHLLFVDAGEDRVSIGTSDVTTAAQEGKLKVRNDVDYSSTEFEDNATLMLQNETNNNSASIVLHSNNSSGSSKRAGIVGGNINSNITGLGFYGDIGNTDSSTTPQVVLLSDGKLGIGTTNDSVATQNTDQGVLISPSGRLFATADGHHDFNRQNDGEIIRFRSASSMEGTISVSGSTVSYNGFSGTHETSGIANNVAVGTICSTIDELDTYAEGQPKAGQTRADHAKIKVSDTEGDKRVYGVLQSYSEDGKPLVASVGIGSIRVTGACEGGDLLESNGDGTAKVQSDDIIRSKTIGKVTIGNSSEEVKLVSCVLYCG